MKREKISHAVANNNYKNLKTEHQFNNNNQQKLKDYKRQPTAKIDLISIKKGLKNIKKLTETEDIKIPEYIKKLLCDDNITELLKLDPNDPMVVVQYLSSSMDLDIGGLGRLQCFVDELSVSLASIRSTKYDEEETDRVRNQDFWRFLSRQSGLLFNAQMAELDEFGGLGPSDDHFDGVSGLKVPQSNSMKFLSDLEH